MGCIDKNMIYLCILFIGIKISSGILHSEQSAPPARVQQCREGCLQKFATEDFACLQEPECSMCWDQCADTSSLNSSIANSWKLQNTTLIRDGSLVSTDVTWQPLKDPTQCLVTWEVSGGGLMGNLLTDSTTVQLSLWPDTIYRVQVTCKNKKTEAITRSLPLTLDTSQAYVKLDMESTSPSSSTAKQLLQQRTTQSQPASKLVKYRKPGSNNNSKSNSSISSSSSNSSDKNMYSNKKTATIIKSTVGEQQPPPQQARDSNTNDNNYYYYHPQNMQIINKKVFESSSLFYKNRFEIILGFSAAILVFSIILVLFILYNLKKSSRKSIPAAYLAATSKYDKELLIDDNAEFLTNHTVHV